MTITVETTVSVPIETAWAAYTTPEDIMGWNAASDDWHTTASTVDLREGGAFHSRMEAKDGSMGFDFEGIYTKVIPQRLIEYSFGGRTASVEFAEEADGVRIKVAFEPEEQNSLEDQRAGWDAILGSFKAYVERGAR